MKLNAQIRRVIHDKRRPGHNIDSMTITEITPIEIDIDDAELDRLITDRLAIILKRTPQVGPTETK